MKDMRVPDDFQERKQALDPNHSFIVQAPAGSGKTSLLVERYLTLLSRANSPEEILAITFTKKAASEMRNRVLNALSETPFKKNPQRLKIQTIDSLCHTIARRAPLLSNFTYSNKIIQGPDADACYSQATLNFIQNTLMNPEDYYYPHLTTLLLHLDNDLQKLTNLSVMMLKRREQWLPHIIALKNNQSLREDLESGLSEIIQKNTAECQKNLPQEISAELKTLIGLENSWLAIANLLLTKTGSWRSTVTEAQGFPSPKSASNKDQEILYRDRKERMQGLLEKLKNHEDFRKSLVEITITPPNNYTDNAWQIILALLDILKVLAAELKIVFNEKGVTDHAEVAMAAEYALGNQDLPSDLALNLDHTIQHILIDEFQDTSYAQYRLLEKLISGWQPGDGRTLFVVGDPMQSIYLFRDAEVGLFLKAQQQGIGDIKLEPITLTTNFRSTKNLVSWVNENLSKIFPEHADLYQGAVPFSPSVASNIENGEDAVVIKVVNEDDELAEAEEVVNIVKELQKRDGDIAILVKARSHLQNIIPALRAAEIDYQAVELDTLNSSVVIQDLFALTRALFSLNDRIAWLAILRAPWCGLNLKDLHVIANAKHPIILENLRAFETLPLCANGILKLAKFLPIINKSILNCRRQKWRDLIENTWLELEGPAVLNMEELEHPELYFDLLEEQEPLDLNLLETKLNSLYAPPNQNPEVKLKIMTIHKAKGLEFDHVILPALNRNTRNEEQKLLLWHERPRLSGVGSNLILAPIKEASTTSDPIYEYLKLYAARKNRYEQDRLFYVAATRAKKSLYLFGCVIPNVK